LYYHYHCFYFFTYPADTIQLTRLICTFVLFSFVFKVPSDTIMYWQHKWMIIWLHKITLKNYENAIYSFSFTKKILKNIKSPPVMLILFHKIPCYHLNKRILWKLYLFYTNFSKIWKMFSRKIRLAAIPSDFYNVRRRWFWTIFQSWLN